MEIVGKLIAYGVHGLNHDPHTLLFMRPRPLLQKPGTRLRRIDMRKSFGLPGFVDSQIRRCRTGNEDEGQLWVLSLVTQLCSSVCFVVGLVRSVFSNVCAYHCLSSGIDVVRLPVSTVPVYSFDEMGTFLILIPLRISNDMEY
ncbi:hypothetical protein E1B28_012021 [Marasmius oreades]|uniref:Uncharacterized protein n=1 Tax=Marasmius oreades TaxID=181124 RepID=A0A9P7RRL8_9AGAR|nr:uncharacterized protein E1B28_012021 [Marasmius oreades]KAG7087981.1 hypothetical protein E1B28_012021 [Marasmius oreades]